MADKVLNYIPYDTPMRFHQATNMFVRAICGPFGSGKSVTCIQDLLYISMRQEPAADGNRYTRHGIIRASYPNLRTTTKKSMEMWYPSECGFIKETAPMEGNYRIPLPDGTTVVMELLLIAVEKAENVKKLRSTDFTAIWINEATEVSPAVLTAATERVGRYPSDRLGTCTAKGVLMDYNKPHRGHWLRTLFESANTPSNYAYFEQPPAGYKHISDDGLISYTFNPNADNLKVLGLDYYPNQVAAKQLVGDIDEIDQLVCMLDVDPKHGKPVFGTFDREIHVAKGVLKPIEGQDTIIAIDTSGVHPSAIIAQFMGQKWGIIDELYGEDSGFDDFIYGALLPVLSTRYKGSKMLAVCDPANARNSLTATTPVANLIEANIPATVAPTNKIKPRIEAGTQMLSRTTGGILISPNCEMLIAALAGGYVYKKLSISGTIDHTYSAEPEKNDHSHPADAFQYLSLHILRVGDLDNNADEVRRAMQKRHKTRVM
jgi:hypothetical protein